MYICINQFKNIKMTEQVTLSGFFQDADRFALGQRMAEALSKSNIVPIAFQNNLPNCIVALEMSTRMKLSALTVMQNLHVIHGKPGFSSQFMIGLANGSGLYESNLDFEYIGDKTKTSWGCICSAVDKKTGKIRTGPTVTFAMAIAEGWVEKKGSKWKTIPELMLMYRAATFFIRLHCPEVALGLQTIEEMQDIETIDTEFETIKTTIKDNQGKEEFVFDNAAE